MVFLLPGRPAPCGPLGLTGRSLRLLSDEGGIALDGSNASEVDLGCRGSISWVPPIYETAEISGRPVGSSCKSRKPVDPRALGGIRTPNCSVRSRDLYPLSYEGMVADHISRPGEDSQRRSTRGTAKGAPGRTRTCGARRAGGLRPPAIAAMRPTRGVLVK